MKVKADELKKVLLGGAAPRPASTLEGLSTGSTLLNLACSDLPHVGFLKGGYYYLVGDSNSGKTWTSMTCFAEATINPAFRNHRLIFDDVEGGALMDVEYYFGKEVAKRLEPPARAKGVAVHSSTIETFYLHIDNAIRKRTPFIYVLDSQDALTSSAADKKFDQLREATEKGGQVKGSYGDGKAKYHSEHLRHVISGLRDTGSILIIIGQTRDNLGFGFEPKTRAGGKALRFYAHLEIWTSVGGKIVKSVRGKERTIGVKCLAEVKKNRVTGKIGKDRQVTIPIYYGMGIDDVGSCVDFLVAEGHWTKEENKVIDAKELLFQGTRSQIIAHVESENMEQKLRKATWKVWQQVESECLPQRKRRYV